ncbi:AHH domain-containing protein [Qipengyuania zhejiangensis]|uniref:AHH domain-containing protein n=1 Tax=Qipengyuania zhejiangensis TaxID=3077782 RepID=UPI002D791823|nr:AHH domain-containing protein [Qipengyuania sp. Z2]
MHQRWTEVRARLPFRSVNRAGTPQHDPALQRHHLLPCQLLTLRCFSRLFAGLGIDRVGFDDFRRNGILLPAREEAVRRLALPLHRGPHRDYNEMVIEKVGRIEHRWSAHRARQPQDAGRAAIAGLALLQVSLRKRLLDERAPYRLNRKDPLGTGLDFSSLDAMADDLWNST